MSKTMKLKPFSFLTTLSSASMNTPSAFGSPPAVGNQPYKLFQLATKGPTDAAWQGGALRWLGALGFRTNM